MATKKLKAVSKKPVAKKPRTPSVHRQIMDKIIDLCDENDDLFIYDMNNSYAFILKRICVTTFVQIQNSDSFCPHDKYQKKEFCSAFYIIWGDFDIPVMERDFGIPCFDIKTPQEAKKAILSYDGETIEG